MAEIKVTPVASSRQGVISKCKAYGLLFVPDKINGDYCSTKMHTPTEQLSDLLSDTKPSFSMQAMPDLYEEEV